MAVTVAGWNCVIEPAIPWSSVRTVTFPSSSHWATLTAPSHVAGGGPPDDVALGAARYQARRAVDTAGALKAGRAA